jgi:hypothetical protein
VRVVVCGRGVVGAAVLRVVAEGGCVVWITGGWAKGGWVTGGWVTIGSGRSTGGTTMSDGGGEVWS